MKSNKNPEKRKRLYVNYLTASLFEVALYKILHVNDVNKRQLRKQVSAICNLPNTEKDLEFYLNKI